MNDIIYTTIHCRPVYHISQLRGTGAPKAFPLYDICMALSHESKKAFVSLTELAPFLHCHRNKLYGAAKLLVTAGWLIELSSKQGSPTTYRAVKHEEWATAHPDCCAEKLSPDYWQTDPVGAKFYALTGGCTIPGPNILKGWLDLCDGNANLFFQQVTAYVDAHPLPRHKNQYRAWRKDLGSFLEMQP